MSNRKAAGNMSDNQEQSNSAADEVVLDLNFVPAWAREAPGPGHYEFREPPRRRASRESRGRDDRRRREPVRRRRPDDRSEGSEQRPAVRPSPQKPLPPVDVLFVPEQKELSSIVRRIRAVRRAYPVIEVAALFASNPQACRVKIEIQRVEAGSELFQCKKCGTVSSRRDMMVSHIMDRHVGDYFDCEEIETEAPTGTFVCVAKCGLSGTLLGPPNHHSYAERVKEAHSTRYSEMSFEDYKSRIEMVHDVEVIDKWKEEFRRQVQYRRKDKGEASEGTVQWTDVEATMIRDIVPGLIATSQRVLFPVALIREIPDAGLRHLVESVWAREKKQPISISFALRAAFKHKHLKLFRAGGKKGHYFVTSIEPAPLNAEHVIESIKEVLTHLHEQPGCNRGDLVSALRSGESEESEAGREVLAPLGWMIEKGHIIEFSNGTLSVPLGRRRAC